MLKLFIAINLKGRNLHSSIINSSISVKIQPNKNRVLDILNSLPLPKTPEFHERGQSLKIYPSSDEEYTIIRETLFAHGIIHVVNSIDGKTEGFVISDRMIMNFIPDGHDPLTSMIDPRYYELFNVQQSDENLLLFLNGKNFYSISDQYRCVSRIKMSPNIIQIRHIEGLCENFLDQLFDGMLFHRIYPPLTPKGVWKLYVANRYDYFLLLSQPYFFGDTLLY
ncbi:hypothetical protein RF11_15599 [Thelohanellus kitauei]|uniref:Uncharacterized protein n=1 Tax=Thelohanellus kitauei TaxID=669202 RepID=A0A0C2JWP6_THEKT|nr:hypothetical protein RF11_15599 [Thelohanellus kitauei]